MAGGGAPRVQSESGFPRGTVIVDGVPSLQFQCTTPRVPPPPHFVHYISGRRDRKTHHVLALLLCNFALHLHCFRHHYSALHRRQTPAHPGNFDISSGLLSASHKAYDALWPLCLHSKTTISNSNNFSRPSLAVVHRLDPQRWRFSPVAR